MDKKVKVVIIDSGLYMEHPQVNNVVEGYRVCTCKNKIVIDNNCRDGFGHGTAVYGIIRNYCKEAKIVPVKIFEDDEDKADVNILIAALEYIYENISCDIINMSIGVSILKEKEQLYAICDKLVKKGIAIIAAYDNYGSISYPAEFDCVIGVSESVECRKKSSFIYVEGSTKINVLANGNIQRCLWTKPTYQMCGGNSFACAHVTGILCSNYECIQNNYNGNILEYLKDNCIKTLKLNTVSNIKRNDFIYRGKKAVIYPFNKENHNLIRYINMLDFEIIDVFDSKYSGKIGAYTNDLLRANLSKNFKIKNIDYIDYNMFDLFIVGHTKKLGYAINNNEFTKNIIEECLKKGKFVYSYDEYQEFDQYINYYNPNVKWKDEYKSPLGKLYRSSTPVVGVFGTTSRQGKFSLQLLLRKKFLEEGYEVGQISSEPSGGLFGMDYCFPFGYSVKTDIVRKKMVEYINLLMHNMDSDKELIIVGCQSSILPYDCGNIADFTFSQIEFLFSTSPDCIILSVNSFDDFRDIDRIIRFMEAAVDTKVIALVVFPLKLRDEKAGIYSESIPMLDDEKELCLAKFREAFNKPVFILGEQIGEIYEIILNCF